MNARTALAVAVAVATAALAAPGIARAVASATAPPADVTVTSAAFATGSGEVATAASPAGVLPARGAGPARAAEPIRAAGSAASASCTEPDCDLTYHGGPVQHSPRVYLVFWGPTWKTNGTEKAAESYLISFYKGLGRARGKGWTLTAAQYGDRKGRPSFGKAMFAGAHVDTAAPPKSVTKGNLASEANKALKFFKISNTDNAQVVIASQSGTCFAATSIGAFAGNCGKPQASTGGYCGFHSFNYNPKKPSQFLPWVNLPFEPDAGQYCGAGFVNTPGTFDGFSLVAGHESTEAVTDPEESAWYDALDGVSGGEVADKCAWDGIPWGDTDPGGDITLATGKFAMQSLWSNARRRCVMSGTLPVTVAPIATQHGVLGHHVSLAVKASAGGHAKLTYRAAGLPHGLKINASAGKITGTLKVTAGTFRARVIVSYYAGRRTLRFTWQVSSARGQVTGYAAKCVDDYRARTANGTKVDIWNCDHRNQQKVIFAANGELRLAGKCITGGKTAFLEPCKATPSQIWRRLANRQYVLRANGKCLTDPRNGKANGRQLTLDACKNAAGQHWSVP